MERTYTYDSRNSINSHALKHSVPSIRLGSVSKESNYQYQDVRMTAKLESEVSKLESEETSTVEKIAIHESKDRFPSVDNLI